MVCLFRNLSLLLGRIVSVDSAVAGFEPHIKGAREEGVISVCFLRKNTAEVSVHNFDMWFSSQFNGADWKVRVQSCQTMANWGKQREGWLGCHWSRSTKSNLNNNKTLACYSSGVGRCVLPGGPMSRLLLVKSKFQKSRSSLHMWLSW